MHQMKRGLSDYRTIFSVLDWKRLRSLMMPSVGEDVSHGNSPLLLVGVRIGVATWEDNLALFGRVKDVQLSFKEWTSELSFWNFDVHTGHVGSLVRRQSRPQDVA